MSTKPDGRSEAPRVLLPVEILEKIFEAAWSAPLGIDERITLFTALSLANRALLSVFIPIALRDVHVLTPLFTQRYLALLRTRAASEADDEYLLPSASAAANRLCRSLTFHVDARTTRGGARHPAAEPAVRIYSDGNHEAEAVSTTLYMLSDVFAGAVPHLRRVALCYYDWSFDDFFDQCRVLPMPPQATELELRFAFAPELRRVAHRLRKRYGTEPRHSATRWEMPQTETLVVHGAPALFVSAVLETVPNVHTLEVDDCVKLTQLKVLPKSVKTIVLRTAAHPRENAGADGWSLARALKSGKLFTPPRELNIILKNAGTNMRSRERLRKACHTAGIRLRFED